MCEFKKEDRYYVLKMKDIATLPVPIYNKLRDLTIELEKYLPERAYVVVESTWPEYDIVWALLEARMTEKTACTLSMQTKDELRALYELLSLSQGGPGFDKRIERLRAEVQEKWENIKASEG